MSMSTYPGNQSGGMGGKSMGGPNTSGPGGYGNNYDGNPNQGGMPTQFAAGGPGMGIGKGIGMDYRNLGGGQSPGLPTNGQGGGKGGGMGLGNLIGQVPGQAGGMLNGLFPGINQTPGFNQGINQAPGQMFPGLGGGGGQLVGGPVDKPIFGGEQMPAPVDDMVRFPVDDMGPGFNPNPNPGEDFYGNILMPSPEPTPYLPGGAGWERDTQGGMGRQPIFGGGQQQPITAGTGQLPPGFGSLSPIDRSQIGRGQIGMTGAPANRFAPPNAPGVRTARQSQPPPAPARVPAARVSNTNVQTPARVAPRSAPKPITRTRSR